LVTLNRGSMAASSENGGFSPFLRFGTPPATLAASGGWSDRVQGVTTMTFNISNMQQLAVSIVGALLAATLFVSAAVGPVGQFI
jgi:hypothetical protein